MSLTERICEKAHELGFDLVGVAAAHPVPGIEAFRVWLERGYHGEMGYLARPDRVKRRGDPRQIMPDVRSVISVGLNYYPGLLPDALRQDPSRGLISNYAWGADYHPLMWERLHRLGAFVKAAAGGAAEYRAYVDSGPVLERAYAARAGLGFIGKNTALIHPQWGPWLFLGELLVNVALEPTRMERAVSCGVCRRCLDACPTQALVAPYVLDARRCISYLTIELKGPIPLPLRPLMGNWIYGCDVCLMACPWVRFSRLTELPELRAGESEWGAPPLVDVLSLDETTFRQRYGGSAIERIGRGRLARNAATALGNWGAGAQALARALGDAEPLVRGHAAWALGRIGGEAARAWLAAAREREGNACVQGEIEAALFSLL